MQLEELLSQEEGKTLEYKENTRSLAGIVKTVVAFANTSGGIVVIGVSDGEKRIIGVENVLREEERLANVFAESIQPLLLPEIEIHSLLGKQLILVRICRGVGPYSVKGKSVYVRLGSTNRIADQAMLDDLHRMARNEGFDEVPCIPFGPDALGWDYLRAEFHRSWNRTKALSFGFLVKHHRNTYATNGGILLCSPQRDKIFPNAIIRCVRFASEDKTEVIDHVTIDIPLPKTIDEVLIFVRRNIRTEARFGRAKRQDVPEYPMDAVRELIINAVVHTDYSIRGASIQVAIFSDRLEITNPGQLPYGLTLAEAVGGASMLRNRILARAFLELNLIEQWGSGLKRVRDLCHRQGLPDPVFEEMGRFFKVILRNREHKQPDRSDWERSLLQRLGQVPSLTAQEAADFWMIAPRTARARLAKMVKRKLIVRLATSPQDPRVVYTRFRTKDTLVNGDL